MTDFFQFVSAYPATAASLVLIGALAATVGVTVVGAVRNALRNFRSEYRAFQNGYIPYF